MPAGLFFAASDADRRLIGDKELSLIAATYAVRYPGLQATVELACLEPTAMAELNGRYRSLPEPTDVLSFPTFPDKESLLAAAPHPTLIGSIMLCPEKVAAYQETLPQMVHHGLLHLFGYDHVADWGAWQAEERAVLAALTRNGLILPGVE